ncbi:Tat (twin-arginine translocation) pathway signal sequence [Haladaptatus litoreus]|uniref:Tat (Twin-arginine translocation) pathway signal sequence n=1 Tax=Haladaptatus litoreus TaxID=553468 RepID=A0A1N6XUZ2_9EURY|nr:twin-arginine translocation signal domain-containing protein [Haladaptatus litoreus]SIR06137.1 Tat (twin-arginine translocation) pathway signal sequence [Haladaptatus litoreus]
MSENDNHDAEFVEPTERRSFMKKGALATGALALGLGSTGSASAQNQNVLVYTYDYHPGVQFRVTASLEQSTTVRLLERPGGGDVPEITQPDDYSGYVIRYQLGGGDQGQITTFVFGRDLSLSTDSTRRFSGDASIFSSTLNLLSTTIQGGGGNGGTTTTTQGTTTTTQGGGGNNTGGNASN